MTIERNNIANYAGVYLSFTIDSEEYLLPVYYIREVVGLWRVEEPQSCDNRIRGMIRYDGEMVPVVNLGRLFDDLFVSESVVSDIIMIERNMGGKVVRTGLMVDDVGDIYEVGMDSLGDVDMTDENRDVRQEYVSCSIALKGKKRGIIDILQLLDITDRITEVLRSPE